MIAIVVNSLVDHVYALLLVLVGWLLALPAPLRDGLAAVLVVVALGSLLWLLSSAEQGGHRRRLLRSVPAAVALPRAPRHAVDNSPTRPITFTRRTPIASDNVIVIHTTAEGGVPALESVDLEGVHIGAHEDWHPAEDVAAVDNDDARWLAFLADARREYRRSGNEIEWSDLAWGDAMHAALATADAWHAEHGAHCACCHVTVDTGEHVLIERSWRVGSDTIEIPVAQLEAAGIR